MKILSQGNVRANDWYRQIAVPTKEELGIKEITVHTLSDSQMVAGLAGRLTVKTIGGLLFVAVWNSKEGDGTFYMTADNSEEVEPGKFYNSFIPSEGFRAYILNFADAHVVVEDITLPTDPVEEAF
jgi:hypothetical protein